MVESIDMKIRWLARQLRRTDMPGEIIQWVNVVTSLTCLRQSIASNSINYPLSNIEAGLPPVVKKICYTISTPNKLEWQSSDISMTSRCGTPIPRDLTDPQKVSPALAESKSGAPNLSLPPCVELEEPEFEEPMRQKGKRKVVTGVRHLPPIDKKGSVIIDTYAGHDTAVLDNQSPTINWQIPSLIEEEAQSRCTGPLLRRNSKTKLEDGGKDKYYDGPELDILKKAASYKRAVAKLKLQF